MKEPSKLEEVNALEELPRFRTESDYADYWSSHAPSEAYLAQAAVQRPEWLPVSPRTSPVSVRFDSDTLSRLKSLARKRHKGYQTLLKEFVMERLYEEEKREGIARSR